MQHLARRKPDEMVLALGGDLVDPESGEPLGKALRADARLGRVDADDHLPRQGRAEPQRVAVADLPLRHPVLLALGRGEDHQQREVLVDLAKRWSARASTKIVSAGPHGPAAPAHSNSARPAMT